MLYLEMIFLLSEVTKLTARPTSLTISLLKVQCSYQIPTWIITFVKVVEQRLELKLPTAISHHGQAWTSTLPRIINDQAWKCSLMKCLFPRRTRAATKTKREEVLSNSQRWISIVLIFLHQAINKCLRDCTEPSRLLQSSIIVYQTFQVRIRLNLRIKHFSSQIKVWFTKIWNQSSRAAWFKKWIDYQIYKELMEVYSTVTDKIIRYPRISRLTLSMDSKSM